MTGLSPTNAALFIAGLWTGINFAVMAAERHRHHLNAEVRRLRAIQRQQTTLIHFLTKELRTRDDDSP